MDEGGSILDSAEVDFLLGHDSGGSSSGKADVPIAPGENQEVTMRGDLDQISLSDIFQTLAMSKMEGLLRVRNPIEHRELFFRDGFVRCVIPPRAETRRLGQMLIRAGVLSPDQLRQALIEQKKDRTRKHLGVFLVEQGLASEADIDDLVMTQFQEDLFGLFTWQRGSFEFYKGPVTDPLLAQRLETIPEFEITGVLMEIARRSDEWETILDELSSLEELFRVCADPETALDDDEATVFEQVDGQHTPRELAESGLLSLFEVSRALRTLKQQGLIERVPLDDALAVCQVKIDNGELKRAGLLVHVLTQRTDPMTLEQRLEVSNMLARCGESKEAGRLLLQAAHEASTSDEQLRLARQARKVGGRQREILEFLRETLASRADFDATEYAAVLSDLADLHLDEAEFDAGLELLEELEELQPDNTSVPPRKARVLHRLGRVDEAVETLLPLIDVFRRAGHKEKLSAVYEQILKIDYRRKDIAKALKQLHAGKLQRHQREIVIGAVLLAAGLGGWTWYTGFVREQRLSELSAKVKTFLSQNAVRQAETAVAKFESEFGTSLELRSLQDTVNMRAANERTRRLQEAQRAKQEKIAEAGELLGTGDVAGALDAYGSLAEELNDKRSIRQAARARLLVFGEDLAATATELAETMPPEPNLLQTHEDRKALLERLDATFTQARRTSARSTLAAKDREDLAEILDASDLEAMVENAREIERLFELADVRAKSYRDQIAKTATAQELTPLFYEARELEKNHEFTRALAAFRRLADEYPDNDEMKAHFEERVERYSAILRFLEVIEEATANGDFSTARGQLRSLTQTYADIPFAELVELPLHVETTPPGARVYIDGEQVGVSPIVTSYTPGRPTDVRIELDGFFADGVVLRSDEVGRVRSLLARRPDWEIETPATVERAPIGDGRGHCFVVDRGGHVSCHRLADGRPVWRQKTEDLSGLLPRPVLAAGGRLIVGSIDGPLRCYRADDGKLLWRVDGLPTESGPAVLGDEVFVATNDGRLVTVDPATGRVGNSTKLDGEVRGDLVSDSSYVFVVTKPGTVYGMRPRGVVGWTGEVGRGALTTPILADDRLVVACDDGSVTALETRRGNRLWSVGRLGEIVHAPAHVQGLVCVPVHDRVLTFGIQNGREGPRFDNSTAWSASLATDRRRLFAADRDGWIWVLGLEDRNIVPRYRLRGERAAFAPVVDLGDGWIIAAFGDRTLRAYRRLP